MDDTSFFFKMTDDDEHKEEAVDIVFLHTSHSGGLILDTDGLL